MPELKPQLLQVRGRLRLRRIGPGAWIVVLLNAEDLPMDQSPLAASEEEAERYLNHFRKYGAWKQS